LGVFFFKSVSFSESVSVRMYCFKTFVEGNMNHISYIVYHKG
jgi:hypothetical protein